MAELLAIARRLRPDLDVRTAFVDVAEPTLTDVVAGVDGPLVVVPVLLSRGYHVRVDIPGAVAGRTDASVTAPLGPDRVVTVALAHRLAEAEAEAEAEADRAPVARTQPDAERDAGGAGAVRVRPIVLVATGSSDPASAEDLSTSARDLGDLLGRPVSAAVMSGPGEQFADVLGRLGPDVDVSPYLLADGVFLDRLRREATEFGVRTVAGPFGADLRLAELILARYAGAVGPDGTNPAP